ncbi:MAG: hypothetical protein WCV63_10515 [Negativicutes bacterium]|jgi:hypothetical protein
MKKPRHAVLLILLLLTMVATSSSAIAMNWMTVYTGNNGSGGFDADSLAVDTSTGKVCTSAIIKFQYSPAGVSAEISRRKKANESVAGWNNLACKISHANFLLSPKQCRIASITYYDTSGKVLEQVDLKSSYHNIAPDSYEDELHRGIFIFLGYAVQ